MRSLILGCDLELEKNVKTDNQNQKGRKVALFACFCFWSLLACFVCLGMFLVILGHGRSDPDSWKLSWAINLAFAVLDQLISCKFMHCLCKIEDMSKEYLCRKCCFWLSTTGFHVSGQLLRKSARQFCFSETLDTGFYPPCFNDGQ